MAWAVKRIHVNGRNLRENGRVKLEDRTPVFTVKCRGKTYVGNHVFIDGPSEVVYRPDKPLGSGAQAWIATNARVMVYRKSLGKGDVADSRDLVADLT